MGAKDVLGKEGEQAAAGYLESCGFRILDRNWRCADGEIDIVAVEKWAVLHLMQQLVANCGTGCCCLTLYVRRRREGVSAGPEFWERQT